MGFKLVIICASALLVQTISAQCIGNGAGGAGVNVGNALAGQGLGIGYGAGLANNGFGSGLANNAYGAGLVNNGGSNSFVVTSSSPIAPTGISVLAENLLIEGPLSVGGQLPLLGVVALEGQVPAGGQAGISYGCGNGNVGIVSAVGNGNGGANGVGVGYPNGYGANVGLSGVGGCNRVY